MLECVRVGARGPRVNAARPRPRGGRGGGRSVAGEAPGPPGRPDRRATLFTSQRFTDAVCPRGSARGLGRWFARSVAAPVLCNQFLCATRSAMQCCAGPARRPPTRAHSQAHIDTHSSVEGLTAASRAPPTQQAKPSTPSQPAVSPAPLVSFRSRDEPQQTREVAAGATQLVLVSDPGQDLDDEMGYIMLRHLCDSHNVVLKGVVATLYPSFDRARLCRGTLDMLGMHSVPVGIGTDGGDTKGVHSAQSFEVLASSYLPETESESAASLEPGRKLLHSLWTDAAPRSLTLVVIASLKDVALFLRDNEALFLEKTKEVVIMGGVHKMDHPEEAGELCPPLIPDDAHNNQFDRAAAEYFYRRCQEIGVSLIVVSRWSAYAVQMPRSTYDQLALTGSSIGFRLRSAQRETIEELWQRACAPEGSDARKGLPSRCNRSWFLATFCEGSDGIDAKTGRQRSGTDPVWDLVASFNQYDTVAILAAVPELRARFFEPFSCTVAATAPTARQHNATHLVIGTTKEMTGVKDEGKAALLQLLQQGYLDGLKANLRIAKEQLIVLTGPRQLEHDTRLMCLTLRALYDIGNVTCLGVVADEGSRSEGQDGPDLPEDEAGTFSIREMLNELGLHHVKVLNASSSDGHSAAHHIADLYGDALPSGVSLLVTSAATAAASFMNTSPTLFRNRTAKVVLVGDPVRQQRQVESAGGTDEGSVRRSSLGEGREHLVPDPDGMNWCLDLSSAEQLFAGAQEQVRHLPEAGNTVASPAASIRSGVAGVGHFIIDSADTADLVLMAQEVPLVCLSRELSRACAVSPAMYDCLATSCGSVGKSLLAAQQSDLARLWKRVCASDESKRDGLPRRCDKQWFARTFCSEGQLPGDSASEGEIWALVDRLSCHAPLAVLACVPNFLQRHTEQSLLTVLSAEHCVLRAGATTDTELRAVMFQCFFQGARASLSEYDLDDPDPIVLGQDTDGTQRKWQFDSRESALSVELGSA